MANDELAILIRAQNLTQQAFDQARKDLAAVGQESQKTNQLLSGLKTGLGALGVAFSATTVISFAKSVFDTASNIGDLSEQLGISTDAVQGFKFAAEQSGSTLDAVGTAIGKMNQHLATGDDSTIQALKSLGLNFNQIRAMKPEDAFLSITDAIQKIPDPMMRTKLAVELFGKSAAELLPAILAGFRDVSNEASKMSTETIKSLKAAQDAWNAFGNKVVIVSGNMLAAIGKFPTAVSSATSSFASFGNFVTNVMTLGVGGATTMAVATDNLSKTWQKVPDTVLPAKEAIAETTEQQKLAAQAAKQHADAIAKLRDELTGKGAIRAALDMTEALRKSLPISKLSEESQARINKQMGEAIDAYQRFGQVVPPAVQAAFIETTHLQTATDGLTGSWEHVGVTLEKFVIPETYDWANALKYVAGIPAGVKVGEQIDLVPPKIAKTRDELGLLGQSLAQLAQIAGGAFGGIAQGFATMISAVETAQKSFGNIKNGLNDFKSGSTWLGILETTSGIMGMASAAITAVKAIASLFDRNKGRDLVVDFAANLGGFDALHNALLAGGAAGEALWIKLTQGVGRNNPDQAKQVIAEVEEFLKKLGAMKVEPVIAPKVEWPDDMPTGDAGEPPDEGQGFASGTPNLDFVNFGRASRVNLHRDEAVIPRSRVGSLAGQIAAALVPQTGALAGGGDFYFTFDMGDMGTQMVKVARKDAARGGLRTRVNSGRGY